TADSSDAVVNHDDGDFGMSPLRLLNNGVLSPSNSGIDETTLTVGLVNRSGGIWGACDATGVGLERSDDAISGEMF
ncbi:hypothetical protein ACQ10P_17000, partial [Enterococcus faecalis]|uniref:hypothetical protein n=1 Tax=Enterococcus faecalis TaxID=1351 RepID=UPI003D6AD0E0